MKKQQLTKNFSKTSKARRKPTKRLVAFLFASPIISAAVAIIALGTASTAAVITYRSITKPSSEVKELPAVDTSLHEEDTTPATTKENKEDEQFKGNILEGVETSEMLNVIENHVKTKNNGFSQTAEQVILSESKEAIEGRLRALGITDYTLTGEPGNYRLDMKHTINLSQVACDDYPEQSDIFKKRDLASYYIGSYMPSSLKSGTVTFTIIGDKITPTQTFYMDPGKPWLRWNEDGGSYMTCAPLETRGIYTDQP